MTIRTQPGFTGRARRRATRPSVRVAERVSRTLITVGGLGTILAIVLIFAFLVYVVFPLGRRAAVEPRTSAGAAVAAPQGLRHLALDEYARIGWGVRPDGSVAAFLLASGELLEEARPFADARLTALAVTVDGAATTAGFADGTVRLGGVRIASTLADAGAVSEAVRALRPGATLREGPVLYERLENGELRRQALETSFAEPVALGSPVLLVDYARTTDGESFAALTEAGALRVQFVTRKKNWRTGKERIEATEAALPYVPPAGKGAPRHLLLTGAATGLVLAWEDGLFLRYELYDRASPVLAQTGDFVPEAGATLTALAPLVGRSTLVAGDSLGRTRGWFHDLKRLVQAHDLPAGPAAVTALAASQRGRLFLAGYADGTIRLFHMTTSLLAGEVRAAGAPVLGLALGPKEDALAALAGNALHAWGLDAGHPEATFRSLFLPVWYEGYPAQAHAWESSSGSDAFEPKFGLWRLVFGTIKATLYSMLFGAPIALLAALFTSEFLHPRVRATIKSVIEMMAGLPSVVLGFLAAQVIAEFVQHRIANVVVALYLIPFCFLLGAHLWRLLPPPTAIRLGGWPRIAAIGLTIPAALGAAVLLGPVVERGFFLGDLEKWLKATRFEEAGDQGAAFGGWLLLLLPLAAVGATFLVLSQVAPRLRRLPAAWDKAKAPRLNLALFGAGTVGALALAALGAWGLDAAGADPRGGLVDTYVQRNALVVGFVMGFAIIPIIYTIAEDALSSVPEHLRLGSLGAGATPWQTAVRIVLPTAMSGLFSAVMIGLGRAVGETMIVLMAAGNTALLEINVFNGFRTLSANIATEIAEAAKGSTHYRVLFLAALVLFGMTFFVNTIAEGVRLRFRRKAFEL